MKKSYILIALTMLAALSMVSCNNNKKAKIAEPTPDEIQAHKQALADSVLAQIDSLVEQFYDAQSKSFKLKALVLTEAEKKVKPDYLLDPSTSNMLVTKTQKVNALAMYCADISVRKIYDMPIEETKEAIAKLAAEVNHPTDVDLLTDNTEISEKLRREYEVCKERGDLAYFWQFQYAFLTEISYILVQNPDLFFSKFTDEQLEAYGLRGHKVYDAIDEMAQYDEEMEMLREMRDRHRITSSMNEWKVIYQSRESQIQTRIAKRDCYIARRNDLLQ